MSPVRRLLPILLLCLPMSVFAQTAPSSGTAAAQSAQDAEKNKPLINDSHPLWLRDLRRAEIIAFGAFPFTFFLSNTIIDTYRMSQHDWDTRYAPWPLKSAGAVNMTADEFAMTVGAAAAGAVLAAIVDHVIVRIKRYRNAKAAERLPQGQPIIIRKPWPESEESPGEDASETSAPTDAASGAAEEAADPTESPPGQTLENSAPLVTPGES